MVVTRGLGIGEERENLYPWLKGTNFHFKGRKFQLQDE